MDHASPQGAPAIADQQHSAILRPIILLWLGACVILTLAGAMLVHQFDLASRQREQTMLGHGIEQSLGDYAARVVPQVDWDEAVKNIDNRLDRHWVDQNVTSYLYTLNGISHVFLLDADNRLIYAAQNGKSGRLDIIAPFAPTVNLLLPELRAREATRPALRPSAGAHAIIAKPIQTSSFALIAGRPFILIASLVQPDFGTVMPKATHSPIMVAALPVTPAMIAAYGDRFLIKDLALTRDDPHQSGRASVQLLDANGLPGAVLSWTPRQPGAELLAQLLPALGLVLALFGCISWRFLGRSTTITSDLIASEARARHLAYHDVLTQLPNRAMMYDRLRNMLALSRRQYSETALHCLDLDRFKEVNDSLGHPAGDELIQQVAQRLVELCRDTDTVARLGGDEFVILQPDTSSGGASHLAERILKSFEEPFDLQFGVVEVGVSIGVTLIANADLEPSEAMRQADLALYSSKENGRNRVTFFEPDMDAALRMRRALETDLRKALADGSLTMVYQPQMDQSGNVASAEALVRWQHPEKGAIPPTVFVALAEESGLILDLGEFIFERVFAETLDWPDLRVAINVSALQLRSPVFMAMVTRLVAEYRIDPSRYEIEITETALLGHDGVTRDNITMLKQEGFTIALDDFGTGYSSLNSLKRFAVDTIKIDRSFIHNLEANEEAEALVDAIIKLARALRLNIVAEGVETEAQRERLMSCGCSHFQGYLVSHPVPAADFSWLVLGQSPDPQAAAKQLSAPASHEPDQPDWAAGVLARPAPSFGDPEYF